MSPAEQRQVRDNFRRYQKFNAERRKALRDRYRNMTPDQRRQLRDRIKNNTRPKPARRD